MWGSRNQVGMTPSSLTRFKTPFAPMIEVLMAPASIRNPTSTMNAWKTSFSHRGPIRCRAMPLIRLSLNCSRTASGMRE